ncbi:VOC family protein, partial [Agrobacterium tumefaciens]|uniref:VOC family protein n=2 Tax=Agrobacterium TaxID=357 RepID=UPI00049EB12B
MRSLFHLAYHVTDLDETRRFYGGVLGCEEGRSTDTWVDFDFFGHQISMHLGKPFEVTRTGKVGNHMVMMPHLGVVLPLDDWFALSKRLEDAGVAFDIPPVVRFEGESGEQRTMFF